jgi:hypothetical protein
VTVIPFQAFARLFAGKHNVPFVNQNVRKADEGLRKSQLDVAQAKAIWPGHPNTLELHSFSRIVRLGLRLEPHASGDRMVTTTLTILD